ncbi:MAG: outer membrane beta-barrel protein [Sideroxydans sp.]|nr:outer membrane beta-barrel protein [Sideroxydans sp.]
MVFIRLWLVFVFFSFTLSAHAANRTTSKYSSYISVNAGLSNSVGTCASSYSTNATCSEKDKVYRLGYGYHFTPNWGLEISYGDFGQAREWGTLAATPSGVPGSGPIPYVRTWGAIGWEIAGSGTLHISDALSLTGKLGVLNSNAGTEISVITSTNEKWHAVVHEYNNSVSSGLGLRYDFNQDFALRLQHESFGKLGTSSKIKVSTTWAGLLLKF